MRKQLYMPSTSCFIDTNFLMLLNMLELRPKVGVVIMSYIRLGYLSQYDRSNTVGTLAPVVVRDYTF